MKKILLSIGIGFGIAWLLYLYASQPSDGPRFIGTVLLPFRLFASSVTEDRVFGEVVYFGAQVFLFGSVSYVALRLLGCVPRSRDEKRKASDHPLV